MGTNIWNTLSSSRDGLLTTSYADDYIVRGNAFKVNDFFDVAGGASISFTLDPTALTSDQFVFILPITIQSSEERVEFRIYENTDYTGGAVKQYYNANRNFPDSYDFVVHQGTSGTTEGTELQKHVVFASSQGINESSGQGGSSNALMLNTDYVYLFEITNLGSGSTTVEYDTTIYQI